MDPREKLNNIQEQKRRLKDRIEQMSAIKANTQAEDPELERLLTKKKEVHIHRYSSRSRGKGRPNMTISRNSTTIEEGKWKGKSSCNVLKTRRECLSWKLP